MKRNIILLAATALFFAACEKEFDPRAELLVPSELINVTEGQQFILKKSNANNEIAFEWSKADFGVPTGVNYEIEAALEEDPNFENAVTLVNRTQGLSTSVKVSDLNNAVTRLGLAPEVETNVLIRLSASLGINGEAAFADPLTIKVTSYQGIPDNIYLIGDAIQSWDWAEMDMPMIPVHNNGEQPTLFWRVVYFKGGGGFKFAPQREWKDDFGADSEVSGIADVNFGGNNVGGPAKPGYLMVVVDYAAGKISVAPADVYLTGDMVGSWGNREEQNKFQFDAATGAMSVTRQIQTADMRMFAWHKWFNDWWRSEFMIVNNQVAYRGAGNDQDRISVPGGMKQFNLFFNTGEASIISK